MNTRLIVAALAALSLPGCMTMPDGSTGPDWHRIDVAVDQVVSLLASQEKTWAHQPEFAEDIAKLKDAVVEFDKLAHAINEGGEVPANAYGIVEGIAKLVDEFISETDIEDQDLLAGLSTFRAVLGLYLVLWA